ncbi:MAG: hypothetical protein KDD61_12425 [Bdellovibrionales bacterium]|nr:hypothetical protein [Bdellovibrionales bacterium]
MSQNMSYSDYLKLDQILKAQSRVSNDEHDEMLFIVIHQVYELWFKQILHEMSFFTTQLEQNRIFQCQATLGRVLKILKTMVSQLDILETLTPLNYSTFRDQLRSSSGFQSVQFRKLEFFLGFKNEKMLSYFSDQPEAHADLTKAYESPAFYDHFLSYLSRCELAIPEELLNRDVRCPIEPNEQVEEILFEIYRNKPNMANLCEQIVDLDEGIQEWRYRHVKMVERTIGSKTGTGGSSGAAYLKSTLFRSFFPDLWNVRNRF